MAAHDHGQSIDWSDSANLRNQRTNPNSPSTNLNSSPKFPSQWQQEARYRQQPPGQTQRTLEGLEQQPSSPSSPTTSSPTKRGRGISFRSNWSSEDKRHEDKRRESILESAVKEASRLHSKADPGMAINEPEPNAGYNEVTTTASLFGMNHKDESGNRISDPDLSNPTRPRLQGALETIRGFNRRADGDFYGRNDDIDTTPGAAAPNPRSSRFSQPNYRRSFNQRRDESIQQPPRNWDSRGLNNRGSSRFRQPQLNDQNPRPWNRDEDDAYPPEQKYQSSETVGSGAPSGSSGENNGYQTDPTSSSERSSIKQQMLDKQSPPQPRDDAGPNQFSSSPRLNLSLGDTGTPLPPKPAPDEQMPPPPPTKDTLGRLSLLRRSTNKADNTNEETIEEPKRMSWLRRRFSKQS